MGDYWLYPYYLEIINNPSYQLLCCLKNSKLKHTPKNPECKNWENSSVCQINNRISGPNVNYIAHGENKIRLSSKSN